MGIRRAPARSGIPPADMGAVKLRLHWGHASAAAEQAHGVGRPPDLSSGAFAKATTGPALTDERLRAQTVHTFFAT